MKYFRIYYGNHKLKNYVRFLIIYNNSQREFKRKIKLLLQLMIYIINIKKSLV